VSTPLTAELRTALAPYMERQRWYGGKGRGAEVRVADLHEVRPGLWRVVADAAGERYQLLLTATDEAPDPRAAVCELDGAVLSDALADERLALEVLAIVAPGLEALHARPVGAEQSNTSVVYDDRYILKLFRRLVSPNPDVEVTVALWRGGFAHVAEPLGVWRHDGDDLAIAQRFLPGGADGWDLAVAAAREGRPFDATAAALANLTAGLHHALAHAFGTWAAEPARWADAAMSRLASAGDAPIDRDAVRAVIGSIGATDDAGTAIRVHGDYHLGQVMHAGDEWYVLDFEGEPTRPLEERRAPSTPLRDVAGMLRSFSYAAGTARRQGAPAAGAAEWERSARDAFLATYLDAAADLLPRSAGPLLAAFEVDKAVYEVAYEQGNRPDWVDIPLEGLRAALARSGR
jgi:maltokinase